MACNGEPINLACDGGEESRVAVYSAHFASAAGSHMYCPAPDSGSGRVLTTKGVLLLSRVTRHYFFIADHVSHDGGAGAAEDKYALDEMGRCEESNVAATESVIELCHGKSKFL